MLEALARFGQESPLTRIEVFESVLAGTIKALTRGDAHLVISPEVPQGFAGEPLLRMRLMAVAHPDHALHRLARKLTLRDLRGHRRLVVRESAIKRKTPALAVDATQRWTFSHMATSVEAVSAGHGFAWLPEERIQEELQSGNRKPLPIVGGRALCATVPGVCRPGKRWPGHAVPGATPARCGQARVRASRVTLLIKRRE